MNKPAYGEDFVLWSAEQAKALRHAGAVRVNTPDPIDWENVAEEIESLGISQRSELRSRIAVVLEHLIKLRVSAAALPRNAWMDTIDTQRSEIEHRLEDSPSLRREVGAIIAKELPRARRTVARALARRGETPLLDPEQVACTEAQVLGDWFPAPPAGDDAS